jgi:hypothetical protein
MRQSSYQYFDDIPVTGTAVKYKTRKLQYVWALPVPKKVTLHRTSLKGRQKSDLD